MCFKKKTKNKNWMPEIWLHVHQSSSSRKSQHTPSVGEDAEQMELSHATGGHRNGTASEESYSRPMGVRRLTTWPTVSLLQKWKRMSTHRLVAEVPGNSTHNQIPGRSSALHRLVKGELNCGRSYTMEFPLSNERGQHRCVSNTQICAK